MVSIYRGIIFPGLLRWCRIASIHSMFVPFRTWSLVWLGPLHGTFCSLVTLGRCTRSGVRFGLPGSLERDPTSVGPLDSEEGAFGAFVFLTCRPGFW